MSRFPDAIITAAKTSHRKFYPYGPFVSIILAQWAVESAYGTRASGKNNFFGIKATQAQIDEGKASEVWTKEFIGGQYKSYLLYFANYDSVEECFDAHGQLLVSHHYIACMRAQTPTEYAQALHTCGYANAPNYDSVLEGVITTNQLTQYDEAA